MKVWIEDTSQCLCSVGAPPQSNAVPSDNAFLVLYERLRVIGQQFASGYAPMSLPLYKLMWYMPVLTVMLIYAVSACLIEQQSMISVLMI